MKGISKKLRTLDVGSSDFIQVDFSAYKAVMRQIHHPARKGSFTVELFTAVSNQSAGRVIYLIRVERTA